MIILASVVVPVKRVLSWRLICSVQNVIELQNVNVTVVVYVCVKIAIFPSDYAYLVQRTIPLSFPYQNYELVEFTKKTTNRSKSLTGYKVGEWLVVAFANDWNESYRIYRINDGLRAMKATFEEASDGIQCAEWLDKTYYNYDEDFSYFFLWTEYPHAEIYRWTQYTIPNGEKYMKVLGVMDKQKKIRWNDVSPYLTN